MMRETTIVGKVVITDCLGRKIYQDYTLQDFKSGREYNFEFFEMPRDPTILEDGWFWTHGGYTVYPKKDKIIKVKWGNE